MMVLIILLSIHLLFALATCYLWYYLWGNVETGIKLLSIILGFTTFATIVYLWFDNKDFGHYDRCTDLKGFIKEMVEW